MGSLHPRDGCVESFRLWGNVCLGAKPASTHIIDTGAGLNTLKKPFLDRYGLSCDCRQDYLNSVECLKKLKVDIYLGNHIGQNTTPQKYQQLVAGNKDSFVDSTSLYEFVENCKERLLAMTEIEEEKRPTNS